MRIIDINSPEGQKPILIRMVQSWGNHIGLSSSQIDSVIADMKKSSFHEALDIFDSYFSQHVKFINDPRKILKKHE